MKQVAARSSHLSVLLNYGKVLADAGEIGAAIGIFENILTRYKNYKPAQLELNALLDGQNDEDGENEDDVQGHHIEEGQGDMAEQGMVE